MRARVNILSVIGLIASFMVLSGCPATNPHRAAQSVDQHAHALYGEFVILEEIAADLMDEPSVPEQTKFSIQRLDGEAKPVFDGLQDALRQYVTIKNQVEAGNTPQEQEQIVIDNLNKWVEQATPLLAKFAALIRGHQYEVPQR